MFSGGRERVHWEQMGKFGTYLQVYGSNFIFCSLHMIREICVKYGS